MAKKLKTIFFHTTFSALLTVTFSSQPLLAADEPLSENNDPLSLYFDADATEETTTRAPKPLSQVAENVSIITADEINAMHAHTLAEVLDRQAGMFMEFSGRDFFGDSKTRILGTRKQHALYLLDGVRINLNSSGAAITNFIPITIIKRIEIIKGPASSTWGSSLGGVVNIITKDTGKTATSNGSVRASFGERDSRDVSAEVTGGGEKFGYYLSGSNIDSNGLKVDRYAERDTAYGKMEVQLPHSSTLTATAGYSDPFYKSLNWSDAWDITGLNLYEEVDHRNFWGTLFFDTELTERLGLHLAVQRFENDFAQDKFSLGTGLGGARGDLLYHQQWDDTYTAFASRLTWAEESFTANVGFESSRSKMDYESSPGSYFGGPADYTADPEREERRGVYANATFVLGHFALTPGLRYDYNGNSEEFVSPSLGATYQLAEDILLRALIAKGFSAPYLSASALSPDLKPETIWAYQAGVETGRIPYVQLKCTLFHLKVDDAWHTTTPWTNAGTIRWNGVELEAQTVEFHGLRLTSNFTFVTEDSMGDGATDRENDETYTANVIVDYTNHEQGWRAQLAGHYYWMNEDVIIEKPHYDDFLWDALLSKDLTLATVPAEVYVKTHNIFNASQYYDFEYPNPDRWVEAGIVVKF
ncbi:MAG: TonB-dependent receptor [Proteobacteria bacterium]|nr:TonB-dependent receptor [Pseudomonadota bacterium]MBU4295600.1 TonB-dependent receptor [Pseudomonadota bacterium]MCG2746791.1 TonB-dependent receptor [Desulfobulbaceae bacterium]